MMLKDLPIDHSLLMKARRIYEKMGYEYIETPWVVDAMSSMSAYSVSSDVFILDDGNHMVGSGEQGFVHLARHTDQLKPWQRYMTITPCFRRNESDETHCEQFMKLELFTVTEEFNSNNISEVIEKLEEGRVTFCMILNAIDCFKKLGLNDAQMSIDLIESHDSTIDYLEHNLYTIKNLDISYQTEGKPLLELGSYGYRRDRVFDFSNNPDQSNTSKYRYYYYGTGLALPRFQLAL